MSANHKIEGLTSPAPDRQYFSWWITRLDDYFSQLKFNNQNSDTLLHVTDDGMDIYARSHGEIKHIASFSTGDNNEKKQQQLDALQSSPMDTRNVVLRLSSDLALNRKLTLPAAISDVIEPVLENQIERIVPWPSDQSWFGYTTNDAPAPDGMIVVDVVAIRKQTVQLARAQAKNLGFDQVRVDISNDIEKPVGITLTNIQSGSAKAYAGTTFKVLCSLFVISLTIGLIGLGRMAIIHTNLAIAKNKLAIKNTNTSLNGDARSRNLALIRQKTWLINQRKEKRSVALIIESLTRILPDNTQLTRFDMNDKIIIITGRTQNAAELIDKLERSNDFLNVRFYSPTLRKTNDSREVFSIEMEIATALIRKEKT